MIVSWLWLTIAFSDVSFRGPKAGGIGGDRLTWQRCRACGLYEASSGSPDRASPCHYLTCCPGNQGTGRSLQREKVRQREIRNPATTAAAVRINQYSPALPTPRAV